MKKIFESFKETISESNQINESEITREDVETLLLNKGIEKKYDYGWVLGSLNFYKKSVANKARKILASSHVGENVGPVEYLFGDYYLKIYNISEGFKEINEAKKMSAKDLLKIFKNEKDWGDLADYMFVKGGNLVVFDSFYYGEKDKLQQLKKKWSEGGSYYNYLKEELGIEVEIVDEFSEFKATGRYKKVVGDLGVVGIEIAIK